MVTTDLAQLSAVDREALETWLFGFDQSWNERALPAWVKRLEQLEENLRSPALVEMVKIDLEHRWQNGKQAKLEFYLKLFPQLGTAATVTADLIHAEYEVRRQFGSPASVEAFARRFPRQASRLKELIAAERTRSEDASPAPHDAAAYRETTPHALSTPSVARGPAELVELSGQFGRYTILKKLGQGGMGTVYLATDTQLGRSVALKVPHFAAERADEMQQRFYREATAAATIDHPNVCPVHDVGQIDGVHYLTMAYVEGHCLTEFIRPGKPPVQRQVAAVVRKLALALSELHARGILHRDLKPSNVMINRRHEPVIMDFGLARHNGAENARLTQSGAIIGTPAYMSPEQVTGDPDAMGPQTDVYGLGMILYELLTGRLPFEGDPIAVIAKVMSAEPAPPSEHRLDLAPELDAICLQAIAKKTEDRYADMADLAAALAGYLQRSKDSVAVRPPARGDDLPKPSPADRDGAPDESGIADLFAKVAASRASLPGTKPVARPAAKKRRRVPLFVWTAGGASVVGLVLLGVLLLFSTRYGTIKIELSDPAADVQVKVDGQEIEVTGLEKPLRLRAGEHGLEITSPGFQTITQSFTVRQGPNEVFKVTLERDRLARAADSPTATGADPSATASSADLSERERLADLVAEIKKKHKQTIQLGEHERQGELAKQLLAESENATGSDRKRALLVAASEIAFDAADFTAAMDVCERMDIFDDLTSLTAKADLILRRKGVIADAGDREHLAEMALRVGFELLAVDRYAEARDLGDVARSLADSDNRPDLVYQAQFLSDEAEWCAPVYEKFRVYERRLDAAPSDLVASANWGQFACLANNDWQTGVLRLASTEDEQWKGVAEQELAAADEDCEPSKRAELADVWWQLASTMDEPALAARCRERAKHWSLSAIGGSEAEERAALVERFLPRVDSLPRRPVTLRIRAGGVVGSQRFVIRNDGISMYNGHGTGYVQINHLRWENLPRTLHTANCGSTRLFPPSIDFSTADIRSMGRGRWGQMRFSASPDLFYVCFEHGPGGSCSFDFTVEFQTNGFVLPNRFSDHWDVAWYTWDPDSDAIDTPEGWAAIIAREPADRLKSDGLGFRCDQEPYSTRYYPPSPKLREMGQRDFFAMVATSQWELPEGKYEIHALHNDGLRICIDDNLVLDAWGDPDSSNVTGIPLEKGKHRMRVEYYEGNRSAYLTWSLRRLPDAAGAAGPDKVDSAGEG